VRVGAFFTAISNANAWTPREGDSLYREKHANAYSLKALNVSLEAQFNISRALLTVNNFNRAYLAVLGEAFPFVSLAIERTELGKNIRSRGTGFGAGVCAGIERYLSEKASLTGEMGYFLTSLGRFRDGETVRLSDVFVNGGNGAFSLSLKSIRFRFLLSRWF
jgi:hypothetical protein